MIVHLSFPHPPPPSIPPPFSLPSYRHRYRHHYYGRIYIFFCSTMRSMHDELQRWSPIMHNKHPPCMAPKRQTKKGNLPTYLSMYARESKSIFDTHLKNTNLPAACCCAVCSSNLASHCTWWCVYLPSIDYFFSSNFPIYIAPRLHSRAAKKYVHITCGLLSP